MFLDDDDFDSDSEVEIEEQDLLKLKIQKECKNIIKATYKGKKIVNGFEVMERLGQGGFATVRKCKFCPTGKLYAMKKMAKNWLRKKREWSRKDGKMVMHTMLDKVMVGVGILKEMAHDNVVRLHSVINDPGDDTLYLILDYCHRKCVMDWNADSLSFRSKVFAKGPHGGIELGAVASVLAQALQGVEYIHKQGIVHRDLKPDNLLVTSDWIVKIADFGVSKKLEEKDGGQCADTAGTYPFMSPQIASGEKYCPFKADIWALGITMFALVFSTVPYYHEIHAQLFEQIKSKSVEFPGKIDDKELEDFLTKILEKDAEKRPSPADLQKHHWLEVNVKKGFTKPSNEEKLK
mmetsp:Transcript_29102/g.46753  ORF Transcript_29102/g.46753 Transcript_29102/m.46753 type:complete len:349 (+) Transcript_29102:110-1156(+)